MAIPGRSVSYKNRCTSLQHWDNDDEMHVRTDISEQGNVMGENKPSESDWDYLNNLIRGNRLHDVISWFESRGLNSNARQYWTCVSEWPLLTAVETGNVDILDILVQYGFEPTETHYFGEGLVHAAASHGHIELVERLCNLGLHIFMQDNEYQTPLHAAASTTTDNSRMIKYLIDRGAEPNARNELGETPLHFGSGKGSLVNVITLIESGSDVNRRAYNGASPLFYAITRKCDVEEHARILFEMGATSTSCQGRYCEFRAACTSGNLPVIKLLVQRNFCISCKFSMTRYSPLYNLVAKMDPEKRDEAIDIIVDGGYDITSEMNWISHRILYPANVQDCDKLYEKLSFYATNPRSLRNLSIFAVRKCFGGRPPVDLRHLQIPEVMKDWIDLKYSF